MQISLFRDPILCKEPIEVVSYKIGVCKVSPAGKDCYTEFHRLSFNGKTSVVLCRPKTGRMHQIRVHLQFLGKKKKPLLSILGSHSEQLRKLRSRIFYEWVIQSFFDIHSVYVVHCQ